MTSRPGQLGAHRTLMGLAALVLIVLAVFVAFRSTRGVPGIPRYNLTVQLPTTGKLTAGADVMIAGNRVGQVTAVDAAQAEGSGAPVAEMKLALESEFEPLPADSVFSIHLLGALGKKYVEIRPGRSNEDLDDGAFVSIAENSESDPVTDIDEVLNTFTAPARAGTRTTLEALGLGLAGRGPDLNAFLEHFPGTLKESTAAQKILADPDNGLKTFIAGTTGVFAELAPASQTLPGLVTDLDTTFKAFESVRPDLHETIEGTPHLLDRVADTLPRERLVIRAAADLMDALEPGTSVLPKTAPILADALEAGASNLDLVPRLSQRLIDSTEDLAYYAEVPSVVPGSLRLADLANSLQPPVAFVTPAETVCSYPSLLVRNLTSLSKESFGNGTSIRATGVVTDTSRNSERGPSASIWQAPAAKAIGPLHSNPYPNAAAPGQPSECESGNEPYIQNRPIIGNVPGVQKATTEDPATAP